MSDAKNSMIPLYLDRSILPLKGLIEIAIHALATTSTSTNNMMTMMPPDATR
jgi:hypothetical protein